MVCTSHDVQIGQEFSDNRVHCLPKESKISLESLHFLENLEEVQPTVSKNNMHLRKFNFGEHMHAISNSAAEAVTCESSLTLSCHIQKFSVQFSR